MKINDINISRLFNRNFKWIKILITIAAYGYLIYTFVNFKYYKEFFNHIINSGFENINFLLFCILLIPLNWVLEAIKWKEVLKSIQKISLAWALKNVLIGLTSGFFTPNRVGEPLGRAMMLDDGNKTKGVICSLICTLSQSFATLFFVMLSLIGVSYYIPKLTDSQEISLITNVALIGLVIVTILYFTLPLWIRKIKSNSQKIKNIIEALSFISYRSLLKISFYSIFRFGVYTFQYYLMLRFFSVEIDMLLALIMIPINYFLISITPSVAFAEIGIRGTYAILLLGYFTSNTVGVALSGIGLWFFNYVAPMLVGSLLLMKTKK
jgi:hypothetical protein